MKLAVIDMRGVGLQVHLLESSHSDTGLSRSRTIRELLTRRRPTFNHSKDVRKAGLDAVCMPRMYACFKFLKPDLFFLFFFFFPDDLSKMSSSQKEICSPATTSCTFSDSMPGTSKGGPSITHSLSHSRADPSLSIEVPSPSQVRTPYSVCSSLCCCRLLVYSLSTFTRAPNRLPCFLQVDRSVLYALPPELREQVEQAWNQKQVPDSSFHPATPQQNFSVAPSVLLHLPDQPGQMCSTGIILELPDFSQVSFR